MTGDDDWLSALRTAGDPEADAYVAEQLAHVASRRREWLTTAIAALRGADPTDAAWATAWERPGRRPAGVAGRGAAAPWAGRLRRLVARPHDGPVLRFAPARLRQRQRSRRARLGV